MNLDRSKYYTLENSAGNIRSYTLRGLERGMNYNNEALQWELVL